MSGVFPITSPAESNHSKATFDGPFGVKRQASEFADQSPVLRPGGVYP